jgi:hypothetical protein
MHNRKKNIPLVIKRKVWHNCIGKERGTAICPCCNLSEIEQMSFSCGHIQSEYNGGKIEVDNLIPICASCNSSMGTMDYDVFQKRYKLYTPSNYTHSIFPEQVNRIHPNPMDSIPEQVNRIHPNPMDSIPEQVNRIHPNPMDSIPEQVNRIHPNPMDSFPEQVNRIHPTFVNEIPLSSTNLFYRWKCPT